jgi:hypothetical protein
MQRLQFSEAAGRLEPAQHLGASKPLRHRPSGSGVGIGREHRRFDQPATGMRSGPRDSMFLAPACVPVRRDGPPQAPEKRRTGRRLARHQTRLHAESRRALGQHGMRVAPVAGAPHLRIIATGPAIGLAPGAGLMDLKWRANLMRAPTHQLATTWPQAGNLQRRARQRSSRPSTRALPPNRPSPRRGLLRERRRSPARRRHLPRLSAWTR